MTIIIVGVVIVAPYRQFRLAFTGLETQRLEVIIELGQQGFQPPLCIRGQGSGRLNERGFLKPFHRPRNMVHLISNLSEFDWSSLPKSVCQFDTYVGQLAAYDYHHDQQYD